MEAGRIETDGIDQWDICDWSPLKRWFFGRGNGKKGNRVLTTSIERLGGCALGTPTCRAHCYFGSGNHRFHEERYKENLMFTMGPDFVETASREIVHFATQNADDEVSVCVHEGGEFYNVEYVQKWHEIAASTRHLGNVGIYIYTRAWKEPSFRSALELIHADCPNVRINLSLDRDLFANHGIPKRIGDGLLTYLAVTDMDLPPAGVDLVFRNLRYRHEEPMEYLGGVRVCPNESGLFFSFNKDGSPSMSNDKQRRILCQQCRLCVDRSYPAWDVMKEYFRKKPDQPSNVITLPVGSKESGTMIA